VLEKGLRILEPALASAAGGELPADVAFVLHDSHGFPVDLCDVLARQRGLRLDVEGVSWAAH
jgi:alanyl-tRNA synthetase